MKMDTMYNQASKQMMNIGITHSCTLPHCLEGGRSVSSCSSSSIPGAGLLRLNHPPRRNQLQEVNVEMTKDGTTRRRKNGGGAARRRGRLTAAILSVMTTTVPVAAVKMGRSNSDSSSMMTISGVGQQGGAGDLLGTSATGDGGAGNLLPPVVENIAGYSKSEGMDLPYLTASWEPMRVNAGASTPDVCADFCTKEALCSAFCFYPKTRICTFRQQSDADIQQSASPASVTFIFVKQNSLISAHAVSVKSSTSEAVEALAVLARDRKIEATDPVAMRLLRAICSDADAHASDSWFMWVCRSLYNFSQGLVITLGMLVVSIIVYRQCGDSIMNFWNYKVLALFGIRKQPAYSPTELAAMWDDDDGL
ncbi:unnamed protein product [Amoebophrya sp. A25]|nr:unnamed protein product [Amoebophrya sp. A25]|eukprot:GSA25T00012302001.1